MSAKPAIAFKRPDRYFFDSFKRMPHLRWRAL